MRRVRYIDLAAQHASIRSEVLNAVGQVLDHGQFILGPEVSEFEKRFAELIGTRFAIGLNSGTDALQLGLRAIGIGPGDEVITAPNSFVASASAIVLCGARPVFVDVGEDMNLDPALLERAITPRTRAVLVVHLTGRPADLSALCDVVRRHGLRLVEDAAQSVLAEHRGRPVGSFGDIGCFSLHPLKTLNACGDGGIATTNDPELYERLLTYRNIGLATRDDAVAWSGNSRLDTLQAAILLVKLPYLRSWTEARRANAAFYRERLAGHVDLPPPEHDGDYSVYHTFVIRHDDRDALKRRLVERGIETAIHYPIPIHLMTVGRTLGYKKGDFPIAERHAQRMLSLPVYPELTDADRERVVEAIRAS